MAITGSQRQGHRIPRCDLGTGDGHVVTMIRTHLASNVAGVEVWGYRVVVVRTTRQHQRYTEPDGNHPHINDKCT